MSTNIYTTIIAEDDKGHATLLLRKLGKLGIKKHVHVFNNGREIKEYLENCPTEPSNMIYIFFLDIRMPYFSGIEILTHIKTSSIVNNSRVFMMSTTDNQEEISACFRSGCDGFIAKPYCTTDISMQFSKFDIQLGNEI